MRAWTCRRFSRVRFRPSFNGNSLLRLSSSSICVVMKMYDHRWILCVRESLPVDETWFTGEQLDSLQRAYTLLKQYITEVGVRNAENDNVSRMMMLQDRLANLDTILDVREIDSSSSECHRSHSLTLSLSH